MNKSAELKKLSEQDLKARVKDVKEDIFKIRMQIVSGSIKNKHAIVTKRKELARTLTILNEKLLGGNK